MSRLFGCSNIRKNVNKPDAGSPAMRKLIYRKFTVENGIMMNMDTLEYLVGRIKNASEIDDAIFQFKCRYNTSFIDIPQLRSILECDGFSNLFIVHDVAYQEKINSNLYSYYRARIPSESQSIALLEDGVISNIYGIFYQDQNGVPVLEDMNTIIKIDIGSLSKDLYLISSMFVLLQGYRKDGQFVVQDYVLPYISRHNSINSILPEKKLRICFFSCYESNPDFVRRSLGKEKPDIAIISVLDGVMDGSETFGASIIVFPCKCSRMPIPGTGPQGSKTNPMTVEFHSHKIGIISDNIFENKQFGVFSGGDPIESFLKSYVSQSSFNPFSSSNLVFDDFPNILVIYQDFYPLLTEIENVRILSIPSSKQNIYSVFDTETSEIKIIDESKALTI